MKQGIGIIYDGKKKADWAIKSFKEEFEKRSISVCLFDANQIEVVLPLKSLENHSIPEFEKLVREGYKIWMNRIYPSDSDRGVIDKGLSIVSWLNSRNYVTINPLTACAADYDKNFAYQLMREYDVPTPKTKLITGRNGDLEELAKEFSFPLIVKRNTGGKGLGVRKINSKEELKEFFSSEEMFSEKYLVQEFVKSCKNYDVRIGVVDGEALISYGRTFVKKGNGEGDWMASCNHGSRIIDYEASEEEKRLAVLASKAIGAKLNEVDIQITKDGHVIIENNPSPGYDEGEEMWIKLITNHIYNAYLK